MHVTEEVSVLKYHMCQKYTYIAQCLTGEPDECLLSSGSSEQPDWRVKYGTDYTGTTKPVCSQDLLCWAFQVAKGMEYLVSRKVRKIVVFITQLWEIIFSPLKCTSFSTVSINPLNTELNPICYLLALLGAHHFLHVSRIRVKLLTFRLLMSYIYGAPILDVSRSHTTTQHSR